MKVFYIREVAEFAENLPATDRARLNRTRKFFEEYGFQIGPKYIKKVSEENIWELRAANIRLFLYVKNNIGYGVHIIIKKSQKLLHKDVKLAERRSKQL